MTSPRVIAIARCAEQRGDAVLFYAWYATIAFDNIRGAPL